MLLLKIMLLKIDKLNLQNNLVYFINYSTFDLSTQKTIDETFTITILKSANFLNF